MSSLYSCLRVPPAVRRGVPSGPGVQGFHQCDISRGFTQWAPLAYLINGVARGKVSAAQEQCQGAKRVLLNVGEATLPYPWVPKVTDVGLLRLGNFVSKQPGKQQGLSCADSGSWEHGLQLFALKKQHVLKT